MPVLVAGRSNHGLCPVPLGHDMILLFVDAVIHGVHVSFHSFGLYTQAIVSGLCNYMFFLVVFGCFCIWSPRLH